MDELFDGLHASPDGWNALDGFLSTALASLPAISQRPEVDISGLANPNLRQSIVSLLGKSTEEGTRALAHLGREQEWPELSDGATLLLTAFLDEFLAWISQIVVTENGKSFAIVQFPADNLMLTTLWFYSYWWWHSGIRNWLEGMHESQHKFERYFTLKR